jgi:hypothetical protein
VAAKDETALEREQQVLADRFDTEQATTVQLLGHLGRGRTRMRCFDLDATPDERLEPACGAMDRVPLWHLTPE